MIRAICRVTSSGTDYSAGNYNLVIQVDATYGSVDQTGSPLIQVPLTFKHKFIDAKLREEAAAYVLAQWGWTIDPDAVYVPFS